MVDKEFKKLLWDSADELRANSGLKSSEYSVPVLGLIFLRFADYEFNITKKELEKELKDKKSRIGVKKEHYQARGTLYLSKKARYSHLLGLSEDKDIGKAINDAMKFIEAENEELKGVLPKTYNQIENDTLSSLLKLFSDIPKKIEGDKFGKVYEYFLGEFAMAEGQKGGEFFTPTSLVKLIVEIIEPYHGRIYDPACGSGGMFVQSAKFVKKHKMNPNTEISIYGQEKTAETIRLCKMNLAVHGLSGDIKQGNTYYDDVHDSLDRFDFVMANPPFNVDKVKKEKIKDDKRFSYGMPRADNANYLWIQTFIKALNDKGRTGFVMANAASDAEIEIRKKIVEDKLVDVIISIGPNFFYTVTLPCSLWFLDKSKKGTDRENKVLFINAREIYNQIDRAHREFTPEQIEFIANIVRLYRREEIENKHNSKSMLYEKFLDKEYIDISGLCKVVSVDEIAKQDYSINPGRYVGVAEIKEDDFDFLEKLNELNIELETKNKKSHELEKIISNNINELILGLKDE